MAPYTKSSCTLLPYENNSQIQATNIVGITHRLLQQARLAPSQPATLQELHSAIYASNPWKILAWKTSAIYVYFNLILSWRLVSFCYPWCLFALVIFHPFGRLPLLWWSLNLTGTLSPLRVLPNQPIFLLFKALEAHRHRQDYVLFRISQCHCPYTIWLLKRVQYRGRFMALDHGG